MIQIFDNLKNLAKVKRTQIDHTVFRLHYQFTVLLLLVFCIVVTTKQYGGDPIKCTRNSQPFSEVVDAYCLITNTFVVKAAFNASMDSKVPYPGIKQTENEEDFHYLKYYQWVGFILFLEAVMFYFPHWLWKNLEGNKVDWLLSGIDAKVVDKNEIIQRRQMILDYLQTSWGKYNSYALKYFFCESLCFANVILQMYILDELFDGDFMTYGIEVARYFNEQDQQELINPMIQMFPRVSSCTFKYFGDGGKVSEVHVLCVLAVNVINEKIFIFLWFWFVILACVTSWTILFRMVTYAVTPLRLMMLQARFHLLDSKHVRELMHSGGLGDWFLLHLIGQNVDDVYFINFVNDLTEKMSPTKEV